ncbi:kinase-like domain-containing protein [Glomus cerebriforme]|uniref:Kinase-like domain-containing protein n=1 Tax=Glomus cerebriforme TaxID=658196 RepID=A0A397SX09_9GLOM|nr:kinase-like domain-containing protein [Glomus cerebriforme]
MVHELCKKCNTRKTDFNWCQSCNAKYFQQNFKSWTSGNSDIDKLIQESQLNAKNKNEILEWIEYDKFKNVEYISKGGFGTIYKAIWSEGHITNWNDKTNQWDRHFDKWQENIIALKSLNNSKDITFEFLNEIKSHLKLTNSKDIIGIYGITKDPKTSDFMMVMKYATKGNLRQNINKFGWQRKLFTLRDIARGLSYIHKEGLAHQDFHSGNILAYHSNHYNISDLGLCKPANEKSKKVYGVLPYVAPEVLRGNEYTQESDIYGFGIILYEVINKLPPYYNMAHEEFLAIKICQGLRPRFNIKIPQLIYDIYKQCVDADPLKRPTAEFLFERFRQWSRNILYDEKDSEMYKQVKEIDKFNEKQPKSSNNSDLTYITHSQAIYTSRLLNFNNLPEPKNADDEGEDDEDEYSTSIEPIDFTKLNVNFQGK